MYQNPNLTHQMSESRVADMRRDARNRSSVRASRGMALALIRPLSRRAGH